MTLQDTSRRLIMIYRFAMATFLASTCLIGCGSSVGNDESMGAEGQNVADLPLQTDTTHQVSGRHCRVVLEKLEPGETESRVAADECVADEKDFTLNPAASTLLMIWYEHPYFGGESRAIYGNAGPCDSAGYGVSDVGANWYSRISSFKGFNSCNDITAFVGTKYTGYWVGWGTHAAELAIGDVGPDLDNNIRSFRMHLH
ncbi:hypothetical protein LVJ94_48535 [Pendulispora rubella]|uniref:Uncharacterized protein n=1 Tax=Pendulispora rubella TaxID=2741070 RepID=A0ABZ2L1P6_9BACT